MEEKLPLKVRDYGIDILRMILVLMILTHHTIVHGLGLEILSWGGTFEHYEIDRFIINAFAVVAVNVFFLISGFFRIKRNFRKMFLMYLECFLAALVWFIIYFRVNHTSPTWEHIKIVIFPVKDYWFIAVYFLIELVAPYLHRGFDTLSLKEKIILATILAFANYFYGRFLDVGYVGNGYSVFQGFTMYIFGMMLSGLIHWVTESNKRTKIYSCIRNLSLPMYIILSVILGIISYKICVGGDPLEAWNMFHYNEPLVFLSSVFLFLFFTGRKWNNCLIRFLSELSKGSLIVYIATDNTYSRSFVYKYFLNVIEGKSEIITVLCIFAFILILYFCITGIVFLLRSILKKVKEIHQNKKNSEIS